MYRYKYGDVDGASHTLTVADDLVVVRTEAGTDLPGALTSQDSKALLSQLSFVADFPEANVTVLRGSASGIKPNELRDDARSIFKKEKAIRFAGRVLKEEGSSNPVLYTENLFIKFFDEVDEKTCLEEIDSTGAQIKRKLDYAENAFFLALKEGTGLETFRIAEDLLKKKNVEFCHPELIRKVGRRQVFPGQWHLSKTTVNGYDIDQHVNVEEAWKYTRGENIVIAVIDDGFDIDHEEFQSNGKIVAPRDATQSSNDPRPKDDGKYPDDHGTSCAGVACADGKFGASGVAPAAALMPIRLASGLGSVAEGEAFKWATDHGADVISCSWGPIDGPWWDPSHPDHFHTERLPASTRLAIDYAIKKGRNGKGCVIVWAAGNGNENVENDGYASYDKVIAVAACNDQGKKSFYSDYGNSVWCSFPSGDIDDHSFGHPLPLTPGIWTTDREGLNGYNPGKLIPGKSAPGDDHGNYTENFGGTSSACPGVAGIAALILSHRPELRWSQVKGVLRDAAIQIDWSGGAYDKMGHSPYYGYGRPDAAKALRLVTNLV